MELHCLKPDYLDPHYLDLKQSVQLPPERHLREFPSISAIAALDAVCVIAQNAITCDNPTISELMEKIEDNEHVPSYLFSAHDIADAIERLRLAIQGYYLQTDDHIKKKKSKDLPF